VRFSLLAIILLGTAQGATPVIIDTDMGTDDMMAISLLLAHREIPIEAVTVVNGLARVAPGAANARRLIAASGRTGIQVFEGRARPLNGTRDFPPDWRANSDRPISNLNVPAATTERAEVWLARRLKNVAHPVRILALGPLTNLAVALQTADPKAVEEIVMMGGAFQVPGNLGPAPNPSSEGNFFVDPEAAARVFRSGVPIRVIPLDATNRVKLDAEFVNHFKTTTKGPLAAAVGTILDAARDLIAHGEVYAWDPLAAAAFLDPSVATWTPAHVAIRTKGDEAGRSVIEPGPPNARVALDASPAQFDRVFRGAFVP
jgi:pyrimidine-specific ribonucleoside hydrolase